MIDNTFDEEYFRLENIINTNDIKFTKDREGKLILTLPYLNEESIVSDNLVFTGTNILPDNVNIIIDNIDLFSTNPNCQNYLPLRVNFSQKPIIEFADITFTQLDNFKLVRNPLVFYEKIFNHRYTDPITYSFAPETDPETVDDVIDIGMFTDFSSREKVIVTLYKSLSAGKLLAYNFIDSRKVEYHSLTDFDDATEMLRIITDGTNGYLVCENTVNETSVYDLTGLFDSTFPMDNCLPPTGVASDVFINLIINGYYTYDIIFKDTTGLTSFVQINICDRQREENNLVYESSITPDMDDTVVANSFYTNRHLFFTSDSRIFYVISRPYDTEEIIIDSTVSVNSQYVRGIYLGGQSLDTPDIVLLEFDSSGVRFYIFRFMDLKSSIVEPYRVIQIEESNTLDYQSTEFIPKVYLNQIYFYVLPRGFNNKKQIVSFNLSNYEIFFYSLDELKPQTTTPRSIYDNNNQLVDFNQFYQIMGGRVVWTDRTTNLSGKCIINAFPNERLIHSVYKMSYDYVERTYPFQLSGSRLTFKISLPFDVPIADMEIFRYAIDLRIRYSKIKAKINAPEPVDDGENVGLDLPRNIKTGKGRVNRNVGDVDRVLGYVGEDFSITDFLNLYTR